MNLQPNQFDWCLLFTSHLVISVDCVLSELRNLNWRYCAEDDEDKAVPSSAEITNFQQLPFLLSIIKSSFLVSSKYRLSLDNQQPVGEDGAGVEVGVVGEAVEPQREI